MERVYCSECIHLGIKATTLICIHPKNIKKIPNWYDKQLYTVFKINPSQLNNHNNCKWFELKKKKHIKDCEIFIWLRKIFKI